MQPRHRNTRTAGSASAQLPTPGKSAGWKAQYLQARAVEREGRKGTAIAMLESVVEMAPSEHLPRHDLAVLYRQAGRLYDALREFNEVARRFPNDSVAANDVAGVLSHIGHQELAFASVERALALDPMNVAAMHNLAVILREMGNVAAARDVYASSLALAPDEARARMHYGMVLVSLGEWQAGWAQMEFREAAIGTSVLYKEVPGTPRWTGREEINGKRLLIVNEQGFGDGIMCARFASELAARGASVLWRTSEPLLHLLSATSGVTECSLEGTDLPPHDLYIPLMSLMHALVLEPKDMNGAPYLTPQGECPPHIASLLPPDGVPTVALTWAGNPEHGNDHRRSIPGALLEPLLRLPGIRFVAMQKTPRLQDVLPVELHPLVTDVGTHCQSFNDSAHALQRANLVVTVDTSVAHLAGSIGAPTLLCLPFCPDFRWGLEGTTTPWYSSMSVLRQPTISGWDHVIAEVVSRVQQVRDNR